MSRSNPALAWQARALFLRPKQKPDKAERPPSACQREFAGLKTDATDFYSPGQTAQHILKEENIHHRDTESTERTEKNKFRIILIRTG
jgi:hypothetical protein